MTMTARPAQLLLLLLALSCAPARGLQSAGLSASDASTVHVEGLSPDNWHTYFDVGSERQPRIQIPPKAMSVQTIPEHFRIVQESARAVGRQMGVPHMAHDFTESLGDGSAEGVKAKAYQHFSEMAKAVPGISGVADFLLQQVGQEARTVDAEQAFQSYSMVAQRLGAKSLANQLAPLFRATTPPNPHAMFNMIGSIMAKHGMPKESSDFYKEMSRIYSSGNPTGELVEGLANRTVSLMRNRTMPQILAGAPKMKREHVPDYYKSTSNLGIVLFQLPCVSSSMVCFSLTSEFYSFKSGPGMYSGNYHAGAPGGYAVAMGIATQTPWSFISTPFYIWPNTAVGHEYDLKLRGGTYTLADNPKSSISAIVKLRESSDCLGTGDGSPQEPRMDTCPLACLVLTGGQPQIFSVLEVMPTRAVGSDALVSFYDVLKFGGPLKGPYSGTVMPDWAWAAFYRQVGSAMGKGKDFLDGFKKKQPTPVPPFAVSPSSDPLSSPSSDPLSSVPPSSVPPSSVPPSSVPLMTPSFVPPVAPLPRDPFLEEEPSSPLAASHARR